MGLLKKLFGGKGEEKGGDSTPPAPPQREPEPEPLRINEITPHELKARLDNGDDVVVVDMRQGWEYQHGHIPGATHMFINDIPARINELPKDKDIVFQCWHGNTSLQASAFLIENGWAAERVSSLSGGMAGWVQAHGEGGLVTE
ncbi:MAG: rhodanese-like domain-containing protein [Anaerolineales bacterium]|nr:rhodanese-like domain-containing protein [Anaerolineales bacterium]